MAGPLTINFNWNPSGNYPAGPNPWNGQPKSVAPAQLYLTPGTPSPAPQFNYILGQIATDLANLNAAIPTWNTYAFTGSGGTLTVPSTGWMFAMGCGGGGGGEGGKSGSTGTFTLGVFPQGGGGAASPMVSSMFAVTAGDTLTWTGGAGGAGGAANGGAGGNGGLSGLVSGITGVVWTANGGSGCGPGQENKYGGPNSVGVTDNGGVMTVYTDVMGALAPGAYGLASGRDQPFPISLGPILQGGKAGNFLAQARPLIAYAGGGTGAAWQTDLPAGLAFVAQSGSKAAGSGPYGVFNPGAGGTAGASAGSAAAYPGCAGAGGGASEFGSGGDGGAGGDSDSSGSGHIGGAGGAGQAGGVGAGGGGGGCGGDGSSGGGAAGAGGAGGNGVLYLFWMERVAP